jgi:hypothetical protein
MRSFQLPSRPLSRITGRNRIGSLSFEQIPNPASSSKPPLHGSPRDAWRSGLAPHVCPRKIWHKNARRIRSMRGCADQDYFTPTRSYDPITDGSAGVAMSIDFYDRNGNPVVYTVDGTHIFTFPGEPVAYLHNGSVYSFSGVHLGWLDAGLIRDRTGSVVLFTPGARGGPRKPLRKLKPLKGLRRLRPLKALRQLRPLRPLDSRSWSTLLGIEFFE